MTAGQQRKVQRAVHLAAAALLLGYVYAPVDGQLQDVVRFIVFPLLTLTGIAMWQAPRIRRRLVAARAR
jgi:thiosulfate reductase cytochrome b subunit